MAEARHPHSGRSRRQRALFLWPVLVLLVGSVLETNVGLAQICTPDHKCPHFTRRIPNLANSKFTDDSSDARVTPNGQFVVFSTKSNLLGLPGLPAVRHVYRIERNPPDGSFDFAGSISILSLHNNGAPATSDCMRPSISDDGKVVAFETTSALAATDFGGPDTNGMSDIYVRDFREDPPVTRRVSVRFNGSVLEEPDGASKFSSIAGDGNHLAWTSSATKLVPPGQDTNGKDDVFLLDTTDGNSFGPLMVSLDNCERQSTFTHFSTLGTVESRGMGSVVSMNSPSSPLVVFVGKPCDWIRDTGCQDFLNDTLCPVLNCDETNCKSGIFVPQQVYVRDVKAGQTFMVSRGSRNIDGVPTLVPGTEPSQRPSIADGRIVFSSTARNLSGATDNTDGFEDIFLLAFGFVLDTGQRPRHMSLPASGSFSDINGNSFSPMPSSATVVFASEATKIVPNLVDNNSLIDIYVRVIPPSGDFAERYSVTSTKGQSSGGNSLNPDIAASSAGNGRLIVYESSAGNLDSTDTNLKKDIFETMSPQGRFVRGDVNQLGCVNDEDKIFLDDFLFNGGPAPSCADGGDVNNDGVIGFSDFVVLAQYTGGSCAGTDPPAPYPLCGNDPTGDAITCLTPTIPCPVADCSCGPD